MKSGRIEKYLSFFFTVIIYLHANINILVKRNENIQIIIESKETENNKRNYETQKGRGAIALTCPQETTPLVAIFSDKCGFYENTSFMDMHCSLSVSRCMQLHRI